MLPQGESIQRRITIRLFVPNLPSDRDYLACCGGEGGFEPSRTLRFAHAYFERRDSIIAATDWLLAQTRAMYVSAGKGADRHGTERVQARESEAWWPNSPLYPRKPRGALGDDSRRSRDEAGARARRIQRLALMFMHRDGR
jgi:hypothetical protein